MYTQAHVILAYFGNDVGTYYMNKMNKTEVLKRFIWEFNRFSFLLVVQGES